MLGPVQKLVEEEKKNVLASKKAAIGFTYDDSTPSSSAGTSSAHLSVVPQEAIEEDESDSDIDLGKIA